MQNYRLIAPTTADEFELVNQRLLLPGVSERWNYFKESFNNTMGETVLAHIDQIQCQHLSYRELAGYTDGALTIPALVYGSKAYRLTLNLVATQN